MWTERILSLSVYCQKVMEMFGNPDFKIKSKIIYDTCFLKTFLGTILQFFKILSLNWKTKTWWSANHYNPDFSLLGNHVVAPQVYNAVYGINYRLLNIRSIKAVGIYLVVHVFKNLKIALPFFFLLFNFVFRANVSFHQTRHYTNPWNRNQPIKNSQDGQVSVVSGVVTS